MRVFISGLIIDEMMGVFIPGSFFLVAFGNTILAIYVFPPFTSSLEIIFLTILLLLVFLKLSLLAINITNTINNNFKPRKILFQIFNF